MEVDVDKKKTFKPRYFKRIVFPFLQSKHKVCMQIYHKELT